MTDARAEISAALKRLAKGTPYVWYTWTSLAQQMKLGPPEGIMSGREVVVVHKGRFAFGTLVDRDGLRCWVRSWLDARSGPGQVHVKGKQIRAVVIERHARAA